MTLKTMMTAIAMTSFIAFTSPAVQAQTSLFWKAESPTANTIYLFGTIHTDDNRATAFSQSTFDAIAASDAFMMETLAPSDQGLLMTEEKLSESLTEGELDQVYALADFHVMHREAAMHMKPWLLAVIFDSPRPLTPFAQDNLLMVKAEELGKQVIGIEDTQEHFGVMDDFTREEQLVMLRAVLNRSAEVKERDFESLLNAYLSGNGETVLKLDEAITGNMLPKPLWQKMQQRLIVNRNALMAKRVVEEAKMQKVFVAVGASHLAGEGGLIQQLKSAGYQLTALKKE